MASNRTGVLALYSNTVNWLYEISCMQCKTSNTLRLNRLTYALSLPVDTWPQTTSLHPALSGAAAPVWVRGRTSVGTDPLRFLAGWHRLLVLYWYS